MSFWQVIWFIIVGFAFVFYLMTVLSILRDLFVDHTTTGWAKALWVVFLLVAPLVTVLVYLIVRGDGMARRSVLAAEQDQRRYEAYIRTIAATTPVEQIAKAKALLDDGAITQEEFARVKDRALAEV